MTKVIEFDCNECGNTTIMATGQFTRDQLLQLIREVNCASCGSNDVTPTEGSYDEDDEAE